MKTSKLELSCVYNANGDRTEVMVYVGVEATVELRSGLTLSLLRLRIYLVDDKKWTTIIIGQDVLQALEIMPEQALEQKF